MSINDAPVENYNANTYAEGNVLHITGNNDGKEILVNQAGDASNLKPLRITEEGLPDLTGVTPHSVSQDGMTGDIYEGLGWQYATKKENDEAYPHQPRWQPGGSDLYITAPRSDHTDGCDGCWYSGAINPRTIKGRHFPESCPRG